MGTLQDTCAQRKPESAELRRHLTDIPRLVTDLGLDEGARREGSGYKVRCPAHAERSASCSITLGPDGTLRVKCFSCELAGDVFTLIGAVRGLDDFPALVQEAAQLCGWQPGWTPPPPRPAAPAVPVLPDDDFDRLGRELLRICPIAGQPDVTHYLDGRGILAEVAPIWGALPARPVDQAWVRDRLVREVGAEVWGHSGLAHAHRPSCGPGCAQSWAWSGHRLLIPWRAPGVAGIITTIQRRLVRAPRSNEEPKYIFPSGSGRRPGWPYGCEDAAEMAGEGVEVAFCEGAIDAVALGILVRRWGRDRVVVGLPGVKSWQPAWAELARGRVAIVAVDPDKAGEDQVLTIAADLHATEAVRVLRSRPAAGADWNEELTKEAA